MALCRKEITVIPPLRTWLIAVWVTSLAGAVVIAGLAAGFYSWHTFAIAGVIGLIIGVPAGLANWAYLRPKRAREVGLVRD
jgi:predicted Abi (CAAX) family protease